MSLLMEGATRAPGIERGAGDMSRIAGFTTTIPVEVLFAAGLRPCDLNNVFVTHPDPIHYVAAAEKDGFPKNMCNWIKGLYGVVRESAIDTVITVMEGDCSNTGAGGDIELPRGADHPLLFSLRQGAERLGREIDKLMRTFGVDLTMLEAVDGGLRRVRESLALIDRMTWEDRVVTGQENHLWQLCASDMEGDYERYWKGGEGVYRGSRAERADTGDTPGVRGRAAYKPATSMHLSRG